MPAQAIVYENEKRVPMNLGNINVAWWYCQRHVVVAVGVGDSFRRKKKRKACSGDVATLQLSWRPYGGGDNDGGREYHRHAAGEKPTTCDISLSEYERGDGVGVFCQPPNMVLMWWTGCYPVTAAFPTATLFVGGNTLPLQPWHFQLMQTLPSPTILLDTLDQFSSTYWLRWIRAGLWDLQGGSPRFWQATTGVA